jgi:hypothetical protein
LVVTAAPPTTGESYVNPATAVSLDVPRAQPATADPRGRFLSPVAIIDYTLLVIGYLLLFSARLRITSDGRHRYDALTQLLSGHGLSPDRYQLVGPLFATPLWLLGRMRVADRDSPHWVVHYNLLLFGLALVALHLLLRRRLNPLLLRRFLLLLVAGTMVSTLTRDFYGEVFTATTVIVGIFIVVSVGLHPALRLAGRLMTVLGAANTPASLPALGLVGAEQTVRTRRLRYLAPAALAVGLVLSENWLRRGSPFDQGYGGEKFDYPFVLGVLAILFSFGKGLVFFVPGLLLPLRRARVGRLSDPARIDLPQAYRSMMLFIAGLILVYGSWWAWNGDISWGPRFFLIAIFPGSLALAAWLAEPDPPVARNLVVLVILALSLWIGADSMMFQDLLSPRCYGDMEYCRFDITDSQLWYPLLARPAHLGHRALVQLLYHAAVLGWLALPRVVRLSRDLIALTRSRVRA